MPENLYFLKSFKDYIHSQLSQKNKLQFLVFLCNKPVPLGGEVAAEMVRNYKRQVYKC